MATVNFSVPVEIKNAFNKAFAGENKSAVLAVLMRQAVEERERRKRRRPIGFARNWARAYVLGEGEQHRWGKLQPP